MPSKRKRIGKPEDKEIEDKVNDEESIITEDCHPSPPSSAACQVKKRIRMSKKDIPEYKWKEENMKKIADFIKDTPQLFDKRQKD